MDENCVMNVNEMQKVFQDEVQKMKTEDCG
jgi:hypothetical protein